MSAISNVSPGRELFSGSASLPADRCKSILRTMVLARTAEERMIKMSKSGQAYFWVGGPGEEALQVPLGFLVKKGEGPAFDYLHLHYRSLGAMLAMGMPVADAVRQLAMRATDPFSLGRNFVGHFSKREWNVLPVFSVIANQFVVAPGTALVQKRHGGDGVTIVVGGDAGTAEGDFESCLTWCTRPGKELPVLIIITDNGWGISTPSQTQFTSTRLIERAKAHDIPSEKVDGNDPIIAWHALQRAMDYCRRERGPYLLHALVSRLYGHSSSSGAMRVPGEVDAIERFESFLIAARAIGESEIAEIHEKARVEVEEAVRTVLTEPFPTPEDVARFTYAPSTVDHVYPGDYTGLPR